MELIHFTSLLCAILAAALFLFIRINLASKKFDYNYVKKLEKELLAKIASERDKYSIEVAERYINLNILYHKVQSLESSFAKSSHGRILWQKELTKIEMYFNYLVNSYALAYVYPNKNELLNLFVHNISHFLEREDILQMKSPTKLDIIMHARSYVKCCNEVKEGNLFMDISVDTAVSLNAKLLFIEIF